MAMNLLASAVGLGVGIAEGVIGAVLLVLIIVTAVQMKKKKNAAGQAQFAPAAADGTAVAEETGVTADDDADDEDDEKEDMSAEDDGTETADVVDAETGRRVVYRYQFSFWARLIQSPAEQQARYGRILHEVGCFDKLKTAVSKRRERIYAGRKPVAELLFRGRRLCMAFALDPAEFENTKYHIADVSAVKRFSDTPTLLRITSDRRAKYACELLRIAAKRQGLLYTELPEEEEPFSLPYEDTVALVKRGLVKEISREVGEVFYREPEQETGEQASVSEESAGTDVPVTSEPEQTAAETEEQETAAEESALAEEYAPFSEADEKISAAEDEK